MRTITGEHGRSTGSLCVRSGGLLLAGALVATQVVATQPLHTERFIFSGDREHVHASSVIETPQGGLLAVWYENGESRPDTFFQGTDEDKRDDVRISGARLGRGETSWSAPFVVSDTFGVSDNNPALAIDAGERLWLVHATLLAVPERAWGSAVVWYKVSSDYENPGPPRWERERLLVVQPDGLYEEVASAAERLTRTAGRENRGNLQRAAALLDGLKDPFARRLGWMPRTHPLVLPDGTLLIPLANENFSVAAMALTRDGGDTWQTSRVVPGSGVLQPSVVRLADGRLAAFFRDTTADGRIKRSDSQDGGLTWSPVEATDLPNPGGGVEALVLRNGHLAMIYNDKESSPRDRLAVSISPDGGRTWRWTRHLENRPGERFDYPSIIQARDGTLHVTYSYNLKTIKHVHFDEAWIQQGNQ